MRHHNNIVKEVAREIFLNEINKDLLRQSVIEFQYSWQDMGVLFATPQSNSSSCCFRIVITLKLIMWLGCFYVLTNIFLLPTVFLLQCCKTQRFSANLNEYLECMTQWIKNHLSYLWSFCNLSFCNYWLRFSMPTRSELWA